MADTMVCLWYWKFVVVFVLCVTHERTTTTASVSMCIREDSGGDTSGNFPTIYGSLSGQSVNPTSATYGAGDCKGGDVVFIGE